MGKRETLPVVRTEAIEAEIVDYRPSPLGQSSDLEAARMQNRYALAQKAVESLPAMIELAKDIVALKKLRVESELERARIEDQCNLLRAEAENFVKKEQSHRSIIETKGQQTANILSELTKAIQTDNIDSDVQLMLISIYNQAIQKICENQNSNG